MQSLLLFNVDDRSFAVDAIHRIFQTVQGFRDIRFNEPGGNAIEADYVEPEDWTIVGLSGHLKRLSLSGTTDAALRAALILQRHFQSPLRIIDTDYSFDLVLSDYKDVDELRTAMQRAAG